MSRTNERRANAKLTIPRRLLETYLKEAAARLEQRREIVGSRIREAREAKGLLQKHLAARIHLEPQTISNWERGVTMPDLEKLALLARELEQPIGYFVAESVEAAVSPDPGLAAEVAEIRLVLYALAEASGIDVEELLRAARLEPEARPPVREDRALPGEAAQAV